VTYTVLKVNDYELVIIAFSALALLVEWQDWHAACKKLPHYLYKNLLLKVMANW